MNPRKVLHQLRDRNISPEEREFLVSVLECAKSMKRSMDLLSKISKFRQLDSYVNQDRIKNAKRELNKASAEIEEIQSLPKKHGHAILNEVHSDIEDIILKLNEFSRSDQDLIKAINHLFSASKLIRKIALRMESDERRGLIMTCLTSIQSINRRLEELSNTENEKSAVQMLRSASERISNIPGVGYILSKKR